MIKQLHPTLKKCGCGLVCDKAALYKHLEGGQTQTILSNQSLKDFWTLHGEVPLNTDDPVLLNNSNPQSPELCQTNTSNEPF